MQGGGLLPRHGARERGRAAQARRGAGLVPSGPKCLIACSESSRSPTRRQEPCRGPESRSDARVKLGMGERARQQRSDAWDRRAPGGGDESSASQLHHRSKKYHALRAHTSASEKTSSARARGMRRSPRSAPSWEVVEEVWMRPATRKRHLREDAAGALGEVRRATAGERGPHSRKYRRCARWRSKKKL